MMLYASTHFAGVSRPGNTPPAAHAAPLVRGGTNDQDRLRHDRQSRLEFETAR